MRHSSYLFVLAFLSLGLAVLVALRACESESGQVFVLAAAALILFGAMAALAGALAQSLRGPR